MSELTTVDTPAAAIERDHHGRPYIRQPDGTVLPYTRVTTVAGTLDDTYGLGKWQRRMAARGLAQRPDLTLAITAQLDNDRWIDEQVEAAMEAAGANAGATTGTALHTLTEMLDLGQAIPELDGITSRAMTAYHQATQHLTMCDVEKFLVCDEVQAAGTADRIVEWPGVGRFIADLKTGKIRYGALKIAMQLAIYAHSQSYDPATGERTPIDVDLRNALVIHMPKGEGACRLHWIDIGAGWEAVQVAMEVRQWRKRRDLTSPAGDEFRP